MMNVMWYGDRIFGRLFDEMNVEGDAEDHKFLIFYFYGFFKAVLHL